VGNSGFDLSSGTGLDAGHYEVHKKKIEIDHENKKLTKEILLSVVDNLFSIHFLVFVIVMLISYSGYAMLQKESDFNKVIEFWKVIIPVITTYMGYAIGKKTGK
jgi:amino acid transporter